jgi:subtilisin family serine protease
VRLALSLLLSGVAVLIIPGSAVAADTPILVHLEPGVSSAERADVHDDAGVERLRSTDLPRTELVDATETSTATALRRLNRDPDVAWAAPNVRFSAAAAPNDPGFPDQWALGSVEAVSAWDVADGTGQQVAVVDSGVDLSHPDLAGALLPGYDYVNDDAVPEDQQLHGTHVTGILAARRDNHIGVAGIAPAASVIPLKVLGADGTGTLEHLLTAFHDAGMNHVPIVSASLAGEHVVAGSQDDVALEQAFDDVISAWPNSLYVVAAGNEHANETTLPSYPCAAKAANLICVGATGPSDEPSCYSNVGGASVDLFAPGDDILSTIPGPYSYGVLSGTSMATPLVSGIAALAREHDPSLDTGAELAEKLRASVDPVPSLASLSVSGGRIDANRAVGGVSAEGAGTGGTWSTCPVVTGPAVTPTPTRTPTPPTTVIADRDRDGRSDQLDACPTEPAATANGCPVPRLRSIKVSKRKRHKVRVRVVTDRAATVAFKLERRVCNRKGKRCRWRATATDAVGTRRNAASFSSRTLRKGRYRIAVRVSSSVGQAKLQRKSFRI